MTFVTFVLVIYCIKMIHAMLYLMEIIVSYFWSKTAILKPPTNPNPAPKSNNYNW